jgi:hypothetical protein
MENYNRIEKTEYVTCYYLNNKFHRLDGPAIEWNFGIKQWYYEGKFIYCKSQKEFERCIKLKLFW